MDARRMGRRTVRIVAGAALLFAGSAAGAAAQAPARGAATLEVYNAGSVGAIDAYWVAGGRRLQLGDELKPGESAPPVKVEVARGRIDVRMAGQPRPLRQTARLKAGHVYCVFAEAGDLALEDVTRTLWRSGDPERVCQQLAQGR